VVDIVLAKTGMNETPVVTIKGVSIGTGQPKIIVPITAKTPAEALVNLAGLAGEDRIDLIELRVDHLNIALDFGAVAALTREAAEIVPSKPLLVTFRTKAEGGMTAIDDEAYGRFYATVLQEGKADLIDVELVRDEAIIRQITTAAHRAGVYVILSNHDFAGTASVDELIARLRRMQDLGADIIKIATMPNDAGDLLHLLQATWEMYSRYATRPMITMAMAGTGVISRLSGELFGSCATFGMVGEASAPGQVPLPQLHSILAIIHEALEGSK